MSADYLFCLPKFVTYKKKLPDGILDLPMTYWVQYEKSVWHD